MLPLKGEDGWKGRRKIEEGRAGREHVQGQRDRTSKPPPGRDSVAHWRSLRKPKGTGPQREQGEHDPEAPRETGHIPS